MHAEFSVFWRRVLTTLPYVYQWAEVSETVVDCEEEDELARCHVIIE